MLEAADKAIGTDSARVERIQAQMIASLVLVNHHFHQQHHNTTNKHLPDVPSSPQHRIPSGSCFSVIASFSGNSEPQND